MNTGDILDIRNEKIILRPGVEIPSYYYDLALWCKWLDDCRPYTITDDELSHRISTYAQQIINARPQMPPKEGRIYLFQHNLQPLVIKLDPESVFANKILKNEEERKNGKNSDSIFFEPIHLECRSDHSINDTYVNTYDHNYFQFWEDGLAMAVYTQYELAYARPLVPSEELHILRLWEKDNLIDLYAYK